MAQTLVDLLMGQQGGGGSPYLPTTTDATAQEDARRRELLNILAQPGQVPGLQPDVPKGIQLLQSILGGLADAQGARAAVLGGMPSLQGNALEQLRQRRMQRDAAEYAIKQQTARASESAQKQAAATELGMMDTAQERAIRRSEVQAARDFQAQQAQLDREARAAEQARNQEVEQRMAADNAALRRDLADRENRANLAEIAAKKSAQVEVDKVAQRQQDAENRKAAAKVKQGIVGSMGEYTKMLDAAMKGDPNGQTPDQIYENVLNEISASTADPKVENDLRLYALDKLGPLFQRFYDAQDQSKAAPPSAGIGQSLVDWWNKPYNERLAREAAQKQAAK